MCFRPEAPPPPPRALPAAIVSPIFAGFISDAAARDLEDCPSEGRLITRLLHKMPLRYPSEGERFEEFTLALSDYLAPRQISPFRPIPNATARADGAILVPVMDSEVNFFVPSMLAEGKNDSAKVAYIQGQVFHFITWNDHPPPTPRLVLSPSRHVPCRARRARGASRALQRPGDSRHRRRVLRTADAVGSCTCWQSRTSHVTSRRWPRPSVLCGTPSRRLRRTTER